MKRAKKTLISILGILLFLTTIGCAEQPKQQLGSATRPNIIIIFTDDQGYGDLGYHGNPWIKTPNLDAFAKQSLELTNFHVGTTCTPSRAGLMTGRNANRNNAWHTIAGCSILNQDEETMPEVFAKNGYETAMFGKWHLGDNYPFRPFDRGFKYSFYHGGGGVNQTPDYWNNNYFNDTYFRNGEAEKTEGYCTDVWFKEGLKFLDQKRDSPFLMYLSLNAAHGPFNVPQEYAEMYNSAPLTEIQKRFYGMITNIDDNFGRLISYLKRKNLFDNTIVIFTTDNGTAGGIKTQKDGTVLGYNAGLRGVKGSHYEGGHKVPFFMSWPKGNLIQETSNNELVAHVDLLPTLAELTGITYQPKKPLDGTSVAKIIKGEQSTIDRMLVVDTQRGQWPVKGKNSCVMKGPWRLIDGAELYNIHDDPGQQNDVAKEHPEMVSNMQAFYNSWWTSIEPDMNYAEIPLGHDQANPVLLTIHDLHTTDPLPWNQVQIRNGKAAPKGFYSINVVEGGTYQFKLYRYPPDSGLPMNASAKEKAGSAFVDNLPKGLGISPTHAKVNVGSVLLQAKVAEEQSYAVLVGQLSKGSHELSSSFLVEKGQEIPAYYTEIEKLD
ncbi:arylsulfatase [Flagellimonas algicola]|uniref:Arylsulfatase n=1 Tax=Flagellimonas algicola TaxID=2583815 RepID=A0ABY2WQL9_9FLAO|nr:arylsulfatase [Allomuricauda algicola]TMU57289.1 arylsulfatase [Allomuricauda algicola]